MNRLACLLFAIALSFFSGARACNKNDAPREDLKLTADEQAVVDLTNAERKKADLQPLKPNPQLMEPARGHSQNMAKQDKLEHVLDDKTPADRTKAAGYKSGTIGENIAWNQKSAKDVVAGWMDSEMHRDNILRKDYTEIGVAVAKNEKGNRTGYRCSGSRKNVTHTSARGSFHSVFPFSRRMGARIS